MASGVIRPEELTNAVRNDPGRRAEVKLYDALKAQLPAGWVVFYGVAWLTPTARGAPRDGETDFILAHPAKGVLLIEVKGGGIRFDERRRQWMSRDRFGDEHDIDPFERVKKNKYALLDKLKGLSSDRSFTCGGVSRLRARPPGNYPRCAAANHHWPGRLGSHSCAN